MNREKEQKLEDFINNNSFIEVVDNSDCVFILQCGITRLTITPQTGQVDDRAWLTYDLKDIYT